MNCVARLYCVVVKILRAYVYEYTTTVLTLFIYKDDYGRK